MSSHVEKWQVWCIFSVSITWEIFYSDFEYSNKKKEKKHFFLEKKISTFFFSNFKICLKSFFWSSLVDFLSRIWSYLSPIWPVHSGIDFSNLPTSFSKNVSKTDFHMPEYVLGGVPTRSSYGPQSSSIEKFEIWRTFLIYHLSSYLRYIKSYKPFFAKKSLVSLLYWDPSSILSKAFNEDIFG